MFASLSCTEKVSVVVFERFFTLKLCANLQIVHLKCSIFPYSSCYMFACQYNIYVESLQYCLSSYCHHNCGDLALDSSFGNKFR